MSGSRYLKEQKRPAQNTVDVVVVALDPQQQQPQHPPELQQQQQRRRRTGSPMHFFGLSHHERARLRAILPSSKGARKQEVGPRAPNMFTRGSTKRGRQTKQQFVHQYTGVVGMILVQLFIMATIVAGAMVVSAEVAVESPRDLCIQAIQTAIMRRTSDLFQDVYLPDGHQRPHVLYQLAEYKNFGDTFIDRGEEMFLARLGIEPAAECAVTKARGSMMATCDEEGINTLLEGSATVLFQGGGNWGDIWPQYHRLRMQDLARLTVRHNMTVVTMPSSLKFYDEKIRERSEMFVADIVDSMHPSSRLSFLFRQKDSYETAKSMYPGVDVRLVPDIAFMLGPLVRVDAEKFKYDILFLARRDKEGGMDSKGIRAIESEMEMRAPHLKYFVGDWVDNPTDEELVYQHLVEEDNVPALRHSVVVDAAVRYFSTAKVIVCDRLHAGILAVLMGIPHVMVDGGPDTKSYGKRALARAAAFETSEHCNQDSLRYRDAGSLEEGIVKGLELLDEFFT